MGGGWWVYLDYSVSSGPFMRFFMRFELLSEILYHSVCEIRDPSLTTVCLVLSGCAVCGWHWHIVTSTGTGGYGVAAMVHQQALCS